MKTAGHLVAQTLRQHILNGEISDGVDLTQEWIASQLGVSRMPIREAMYMLEFEGYVERLGNRRLRVIGLERGMLQSRLTMYGVIESDACMHIARKGNVDRVGLELSKVLSSSDLVVAETLFHESIFRLMDDGFYNQMYYMTIKPTFDILIEMKKTNCECRLSILSKLVASLKDCNNEGITQHVCEYFTELQINE
jgi:DNA-binding GntR family transcriptional regulator